MIGSPAQMRGEHWSGSLRLGVRRAGPAPRQWLGSVPPARHGEGAATSHARRNERRGNRVSGACAIRSDRLHTPCGLIGNTSKIPWKETGPVADRKQFIED